MLRAVSWRYISPLVVGILCAAFFVLSPAAHAQTTSTTSSDPKAACLATSTNNWCYSSGSTTGWCAYNAKCPAYNEADCKAQSGSWCAGTNGAQGWCATGSAQCPTPAPADPKATCLATTGNNWCYSSGSTTGWCAYNSKCPAYNETDCKAQGQNWCPAQNGGSAWCQSGSCPSVTTTTTSTPPTTQTEEQKCTAMAGGKWCKYQTGTGGWCTMGTSVCPAYTETDCTVQKGEWCAGTTSSYGTSNGWCSSTPGYCPVNDKATCVAKGRSWCDTTYSGGSATTPVMNSGWCASTGSTCPSTTPNPTPTPTPTGSWPSTQSSCEDMYGKWCANTGGSSSMYSSGWCQMATMNCPPAVKSGYTMCWDNSQATTYSACPANPSTEADCTKTGNYWCKNMYSGSGSGTMSGWCQPNACQTMPPSGQMSCPDGKSFAASFDKCPRRGTTDVTPPPTKDEFKTCSGGRVVRTVETCPPVDAIVQCANGTTAPTMSACPPIELKKDEISMCLNTGSIWCSDVSGASKGWCQAKNIPCATTVTDKNKQDHQVDISRPLTSRERHDMELTRSNMVRDLKQFESVARRAKNDALLTKVTTLRKAIETATLKDSSSFEIMKDFDSQLSDIRDAMSSDISNDANQLDEQMQAKALKKMQQGAKSFMRQLQSKKAQIDRLTKQGVKVDSDILDLVSQALDLAGKIVAATNYNDARALMEQVPDLANQMNDVFPKLEMLSRLPRALAIVDREIAATDRVVKSALLQAKRRGIADAEPVQKMAQLLAGARDAAAQIRSGSVAADDVMDFIQSDIIDALQTARDLAQGVTSVANAKTFIPRLLANMTKYDRVMNQMKARGEDVGDVENLLPELGNEVRALKTMIAGKLTQDTAAEIVASLERVNDLVGQIEGGLGLSKPRPVIDELRRSLENGGESFGEIRVNDLERLIVRAYRTSRFAEGLTTAHSFAFAQ